jgi:hypothetical protein
LPQITFLRLHAAAGTHLAVAGEPFRKPRPCLPLMTTSFVSFAEARRQLPSTPRWCRRASSGCSRSTAAGVLALLCRAARKETLLAEARANGITITIKQAVFIATRA